MDVAFIVVRPFHSYQVGDLLTDAEQIQVVASDERSHSVVRSVSFPPAVVSSEEIS